MSSLQPAWKWKRKLSSQTHWKPVYPHWWCQYKVAYVGYVNATGNCRNKENKQVLRTFRFLELDINILASDFTKAVIDLRFSYLSIYLIYLNNINEQNKINCKTSWRSISVSQSGSWGWRTIKVHTLLSQLFLILWPPGLAWKYDKLCSCRSPAKSKSCYGLCSLHPPTTIHNNHPNFA